MSSDGRFPGGHRLDRGADPVQVAGRRLAAACSRRPQTASSVTATPMTSSSTVVSMSVCRLMLNRS